MKKEEILITNKRTVYLAEGAGIGTKANKGPIQGGTSAGRAMGRKVEATVLNAHMYGPNVSKKKLAENMGTIGPPDGADIIGHGRDVPKHTHAEDPRGKETIRRGTKNNTRPADPRRAAGAAPGHGDDRGGATTPPIDPY